MNKLTTSLLLCSLLITACQPLLQNSSTTSTPSPTLVCPPAPTPTTTTQKPAPPSHIPCPACKTCPTTNQPISITPLTVGAVERVKIEPPGITSNARIDTGAKSSSMHAENITTFEREGERWVSFDVRADNRELTTIKLPIERRVRITQANNEMQRRYVVNMRITLGSISEVVDITLADRSELEYPILIGRNFLVDTATVDVSKRFTQK